MVEFATHFEFNATLPQVVQEKGKVCEGHPGFVVHAGGVQGNALFNFKFGEQEFSVDQVSMDQLSFQRAVMLTVTDKALK